MSAFIHRTLQNVQRFDRDWLSRGMSDPASLRAQARRYRELKGREITWVLPS
jgi:enoyl-CoA hydratase